MFSDEEFAPSTVTDREFVPHITGVPNVSREPMVTVKDPGQATTVVSNIVALEISPVNQQTFVGPETFRGFPKAGPRKLVNKGRKKGRCRIATDTDEKRELEEDERKKMLILKRRKIK